MYTIHVGSRAILQAHYNSNNNILTDRINGSAAQEVRVSTEPVAVCHRVGVSVRVVVGRNIRVDDDGELCADASKCDGGYQQIENLKSEKQNNKRVAVYARTAFLISVTVFTIESLRDGEKALKALRLRSIHGEF